MEAYAGRVANYYRSGSVFKSRLFCRGDKIEKVKPRRGGSCGPITELLKEISAQLVLQEHIVGVTAGRQKGGLVLGARFFKTAHSFQAGSKRHVRVGEKFHDFRCARALKTFDPGA